MGRIGIDDLEELQSLKLDLSEQDELLDTQTECTFVFANDQGWPSGVIMSFVRADGSFWLTAVETRAHAKALATEPRVTLVVSNAGTGSPGRQMLAVRGVATVHRDLKIVAHSHRELRQRQPGVRTERVAKFAEQKIGRAHV